MKKNIGLSEPARAARREYQKQWRKDNKDKIKANTARYWERQGAKMIAAEAANGNQQENDAS